MPSLVLKLVFGVYPILWALRFMFYDYKGYGDPVFSGWANFERLMRDELFWESVLNTFVYAGGSCSSRFRLLWCLPLFLTASSVAGNCCGACTSCPPSSVPP